MKQQRSSRSREDAPVGSAFAPQVGASLADAVGKGAALFGRGFASMQQEGFRFLNQRFEDNMKAASEVGNCKSLPDLLAFQQRWLANMTRAYADEWHRYNLLMTDIVRGNGEVPEEDASARAARPRED